MCHDKPSARTAAGAGAAPRTGRRLGAMTWRDVRAALDSGCDRVVVPLGAVEQHGCHLPLETDALLGDHLGPLLAGRLGALCAPTIRIGCSEHHMGRAGTLSLRPATLQLIVRDLVDSLARHGFRTIVFLPTHAGNAAPLAHAARVVEPPPGVRIAAVTDMQALACALYAARGGRRLTLAEAIAHAGEIETSLMLALNPATVKALSDQAADRTGSGKQSAERSAAASPPSSSTATRAMEAAGRCYVAAFLAESVRQLETQGVVPCACA